MDIHEEKNKSQHKAGINWKKAKHYLFCCIPFFSNEFLERLTFWDWAPMIVGNDIVIKDEETKKALLQLGQNIYDFQERFIAVFFKDWSDTLNAVKKTDNQGIPDNCNPYYKEFRCSIQKKDDNTNRYVLSGVKGTPLMYFNNKSNAEQFLSILRNVVNVIIDYYRTL